MKKRGGFWKALGIYGLVLILLAAAGLTVFWFYISAYESSRPEKTVEEYLAVQSRDYWVSGVESAIKAGGPFEKKSGSLKDYGVELPESYKLDYRRDVAGNAGEECYIVSAGGADIGRLTLKPSGSAGFGFSNWSAAKCEFLAGSAKTVRITAPESAVVTLNGVTVPDSMITAEDAVFELTPEHDFDVCPTGVTYTVEGLHGPVEASAESGDGVALEPGEAKGSDISFLPDAPYSFRCCAPEGAVVRVNGTELPAEYNEAEATGLTAEFAQYTSGVGVGFFSCQGLLSEPELSAEKDGKKLEAIAMDDGLISFVPGSAALLPLEKQTTVEYFIKAYVNFSANIGNELKANYDNLCLYLVPGTDFAARLASSLDSQQWVSTSSVSYDTLSIHDYIPLGDHCFLCMVDYELTNRAVFVERKVSARCTVLFVSYEGAWKVGGMLVEQ